MKESAALGGWESRPWPSLQTRRQSGLCPPSPSRSLIPALALHKFIFKNLDASFSESDLKIHACVPAVAMCAQIQNHKRKGLHSGSTEHRNAKLEDPFLPTVSGDGICSYEAHVHVRVGFMNEQKRFPMQSHSKDIKEDFCKHDPITALLLYLK